MKKLIILQVVMIFALHINAQIKASKVSNPTSTITIIGTSVQTNHSNFLNLNSLIGIKVGCICNHQPCEPCDDKNSIITWLKPGDLLKTSKLNTKNYDGKQLYIYEIKKTAELQIQSFLSMKAGGYEALVNGVPGPSPVTTLPSPSQNTNAAKLSDLVAAFKVGWYIGTYVDEQFGISTSIANWACRLTNCNGLNPKK